MHLITADKMQRGEYTMIKIKWHQENEPRMHVNTREGVTYLTYPEFDRLPGFVHAFSTRLGGVSEGTYSSMNLSFTRGDKDEAVRENYRRLADAVRHIRQMCALSQKKTAETASRNQDRTQTWMG